MALGNQFLLPTKDAVAVSEHLVERYQLPKRQLTLAATQANNEVIRLSRELTGREIVLVFDGKYHGESDATIAVLEEGELVPGGRTVDIVRQNPLTRSGDMELSERMMVERYELGNAHENAALRSHGASAWGSSPSR
jgi:glutamate-1-semialdehyde 2,1-aminomutase